ncbi:endonuclease/exonuclease/phosphatase family protein [Ruicaihuangia caeni]|uniref:Endonuclease/exonuclease/phosphatase family protein n=1 Tax=Ruicaihuangia caeni TaxID=3042517 RepID=A0AAW6T9X2_9MICO|nr:endonuclease/exonuclease/phosphatase family protein [Klugiella sp. YN-L-19]MDI2099169.1 endonuclease/exonuclease/phosphatase family protein [Klugiella sp. YN-L-19]
MTDAALIGPVDPPGLHVMTYNIRRRFPALRPRSPDAWNTRKHLLKRLLTTERPTLLGTQEALADQAHFVAEVLGSDFGSVGHGRNADGGGERCPIYFDTRRLELNEWKQSALSATPDIPGSRSWGNRIPRVVVAADFTDRSTGRRVFAFNTHFDHISRRSKLHSARMITRLAAEARKRDPDAAIVVTGDVNAGSASAAHQRLTARGLLRDCWTAAEHRLTPQWGTYSHYRRPRQDGRRIDVILVGPGLRVLRAGINAARFDGAAASDHEPVQAVLLLQPQTPPSEGSNLDS